MGLDPATKDFLKFLNKNPSLRLQIKAPHNKTLLYAGRQIQAAWREIEHMKRTEPSVREKVTLPDVLARLRTSNSQYPTLLSWVQSVDKIQPWKQNGFIAWRALSGIFAANASGQVSFIIGSGVAKEEKVFAATELPILLRNPNIDTQTKDILAYYDRCVKSKNAALNFGFNAG